MKTKSSSKKKELIGTTRAEMLEWAFVRARLEAETSGEPKMVEQIYDRAEEMVQEDFGRLGVRDPEEGWENDPAKLFPKGESLQPATPRTPSPRGVARVLLSPFYWCRVRSSSESHVLSLRLLQPL